MGFLDVIMGKRKLTGPAPDRLFAMSTAYVKLETELSITTAAKAAIVFQPLATADFTAIVKDMEQVVQATAADSGITVESDDDSYGFRWLILRGQDFDGLVVGPAPERLQRGSLAARYVPFLVTIALGAILVAIVALGR